MSKLTIFERFLSVGNLKPKLKSFFKPKLKPKFFHFIGPQESEDGLRIDLLKTVFSDNRYPWPAGKSPWAAEAANIAGGGGACSSQTANKEGDKVSLSDSPTVQLLVGIVSCLISATSPSSGKKNKCCLRCI